MYSKLMLKLLEMSLLFHVTNLDFLLYTKLLLTFRFEIFKTE